MKNDIVIFDLCGTLYDSNTTFDFIRFLRPLYALIIFSLPLRVFAKCLSISSDIDLIRNLAIYGYKGFSQDQLLQQAERFITDILENKKILEADELLLQYSQDNSVTVYLASASIDPIVQLVARRYAVSYVSSQLEYINGKSSGKLNVDLLGDKKKYLTNSYYQLVVTDNKSDIDLILASQKAYIVTKKKNVKYWQNKLRTQDIILKII